METLGIYLEVPDPMLVWWRTKWGKIVNQNMVNLNDHLERPHCWNFDRESFIDCLPLVNGKKYKVRSSARRRHEETYHEDCQLPFSELVVIDVRRHFRIVM